MAGYLYQCRLALLQGLKLGKINPNGQISIEKFDDVAFENEDDLAECLMQAKHSINPASMTDTSTDVWKTIRIWAEKTQQDPQFPTTTKFFLITTTTAIEGTALSKLRAENSKEEREEARLLLLTAAKTSTNKVTQAGREVFLALTVDSQKALLAAVVVFDQSPNLVDMRSELESELYYSSPDNISLIVDTVEGWWFSSVARSLLKEGQPSIPVQNILQKLEEISGLIRRKELPILNIGDTPDYSETDEGSIYVQQMRVIELPESTIRRGVKDYYKAQTQRSKWARENLLLDGESEYFDQKLEDQWARKFDQENDVTPAPDENAKKQAGKNLFYWSQNIQIPFRNIVETWITTGSFHSLANRVKVGWHPDHKEIFPQNGEEI